MATATELVNRNNLNGFSLAKPILQLLCGPFTGPGSQAMAVVIGPLPTCWPSQNWAVFSLTGGDWKLVLNQAEFIDPPLVRVGSDIKETAPVFRPGDPRCIPSGGSHARIWHWNGTRFVAGAWKQVKAPNPITVAQFYSPSRNILCGMLDASPRSGAGVTCWTVKPEQRVGLGLNGKLTICRNAPQGRCAANLGDSPVPRKLGYGQRIRVGRFRCSSALNGVTCVVIHSGKGFLINTAGIKRVG